MLSAILLCSSIICAVVYVSIQNLRQLLAVRSAYRNVPGGLHYHLLDPEAIFTMFLPIPPISKPGRLFAHAKPYEIARSTVIVSTPIFNARPIFWVVDAGLFKEVGNNRSTFAKHSDGYRLVTFYGENIIAAPEPHWRRHRDVAKNAFGEANNMLVWAETRRLALEWFIQLDKLAGQDGAAQVDGRLAMKKFALLVISSAQFGQRSSFNDPEEVQANSTGSSSNASFQTALATVAETALIKLSVPGWVYRVPVIGGISILKRSADAYDELKRQILSMMNTFKDSPSRPDDASVSDLFSLLVESNEAAESGECKLSEGEILSNIYIFLLAGHETTAGVAAFALALLALNRDVQEKLQSEVDSVWLSGEDPSGEESYRNDMPRLKYAEAVFREALRLFPPVQRLPKDTTVDTVLTFSQSHDESRGPERVTLAVPKGAAVWLDLSGILRMKQYWGEDAEEFRPERFIDTSEYAWPRDAFHPFGTGPRTCIGQRFAMLEGICLIAHIAHRYDILVPPQLAHLPDAEKCRTLLARRWNMTAVPTHCQVIFRPRTSAH